MIGLLPLLATVIVINSAPESEQLVDGESIETTPTSKIVGGVMFMV